jgi:hypothetical protein
MSRCVTFSRTCAACPEQYDALAGVETVGYVRLRWGRLTVEQGGVGGPVVLEQTWPDEPYKGAFDDAERDECLSAAAAALGFEYYELEEAEPSEAERRAMAMLRAAARRQGVLR